MNGRWFTWNAKWSGRTRQEGTDLFKKVYRRIVDKINAPNVTWVFHVNAWEDPDEPWNDIKNYYPGKDYVDWFGVSIYGVQEPSNECNCFKDSMNHIYHKLTNLEPDKSIPIFVLEFGSAENNKVTVVDKNCKLMPECQAHAWANDALDAILNEGAKSWPQLRGFSWWNEAWKEKKNLIDMRVDTVPCLADVFRSYLDRPNVIHQIIEQKSKELKSEQ